MERQNIMKVFSTKTDGKTPSDVLTLEELVMIAPHISPEVLFKTVSFAYWHEKFINSYGDLYLNEFRELDNDTQRYILFCWFIGCHLWKWNESIFDHEVTDEFCYFDNDDWKRANDAIMVLATSGLG